MHCKTYIKSIVEVIKQYIAKTYFDFSTNWLTSRKVIKKKFNLLINQLSKKLYKN